MPMIIIDEGPGSAASPPYNNNPGGTTMVVRAVDLSHFQTPPGWAKLAQIVLGVLVICLGPPFYLLLVSWLALLGTIPWCWIYFLQINKRYAVNPPWIVLEFYFTAGVLLAYVVMTFISFIALHWPSAICGLLASGAYGVGAYFLFLEWRAWRANPINSATSVPK